MNTPNQIGLGQAQTESEFIQLSRGLHTQINRLETNVESLVQRLHLVTLNEPTPESPNKEQLRPSPARSPLGQIFEEEAARLSKMNFILESQLNSLRI